MAAKMHGTADAIIETAAGCPTLFCTSAFCVCVCVCVFFLSYTNISADTEGRNVKKKKANFNVNK